ncbi:hypothetical protein OA867_00610 [Prochlorococcus sp. AH-716-D22]|nr:hypothetical protein [Prochlorococcus sp. AH-716-D22]
MPTQRRRIGFLPRSEVHDIINKICNHNKLSQSKVTGILVEEALSTRGILKVPIKKLSFEFLGHKSEAFLSAHKTFNSEMPDYEDYLNLDYGSMNDEVQMINDFVEFKFFKNIMIRNKRMNKK